jgi:hypothetical protein
MEADTLFIVEKAALFRRVLLAAVDRAGVDEVVLKLRIPRFMLRQYLTSDLPIPEPLFLLAVDVVLDGLPATSANQPASQSLPDAKHDT